MNEENVMEEDNSLSLTLKRYYKSDFSVLRSNEINSNENKVPKITRTRTSTR